RLHVQMLRTLDSGLQARASAIAASVGQLRRVGRAISDGPDAPAGGSVQILTSHGRVLADSGMRFPAVLPRYLRNLRSPTFIQVNRPGSAAPLRLYLLPINEGRPLVVVTGTTLAGL